MATLGRGDGTAALCGLCSEPTDTSNSGKYNKE